MTAVVLLGAGGMLGRAFSKLLTRQRVAVNAFTRIQCDITNEAAVAQAIDGNASHVINCAAYTDVDGAETNLNAADHLNVYAPSLLAERCKAVGATLVNFSTDYVFNGQADSPYAVDTPRDPVNAYGESKAHGEAAIEAVGGNHLIVRTSWLYAPWGRNFVRTIAKLATESEALSVVNDQRGRPTSCEGLADITMRLIESDATGVYHATDGGECTWFNFAAEIAGLLNLDCDIQPCTTDKFPRPARRPAYSVLDITKTTERIGEPKAWQVNLADVLARLEPFE